MGWCHLYGGGVTYMGCFLPFPHYPSHANATTVIDQDHVMFISMKDERPL